MSARMRPNPTPVPPSLVALGAAALALTVALTGCGPTGDDTDRLDAASEIPVFTTDPDVPVVEDLVYGRVDGTELLLDACLPPELAEPDEQIADAAEGAPTGTPEPAPPEPLLPDAPEPPATPPPPSAAPGESPPPAIDPGAGRSAADAPPGDEPEADAADDSADPETESLRPAIVVVHGGSWTRGDKADIAWRSTCQWLATAGYPAFSVNYRLAPEHVYPAAIRDLEQAVAWLRQPEQVERFRIDPERIGALGGSAGGNLVSLLGTAGRGDTTQGSRVAAVAELSGPVDLTGANVTRDFLPVQLQYLGCSDLAACRVDRAASAPAHVDPSDPPFFVAHSAEERIPIAQSREFVRRLRDEGVDTTFVTVEGRLHSIAMLDDALRKRILEFFDTRLAGRPAGVVP